jgi:hypothetical protein
MRLAMDPCVGDGGMTRELPEVGEEVLVTVFGSVSLHGRVERIENGWFWVRVVTGSLVVCGRSSLVPAPAAAPVRLSQ